MAIGPVQLIVLGFSHPDFHGEVIAELERLRENDTVRVVDSLAVYKDAAAGAEEVAAAGGVHVFAEEGWDALEDIPNDTANSRRPARPARRSKEGRDVQSTQSSPPYVAAHRPPRFPPPQVMATEFILGATVRGSDGVCGEVVRAILDPAARTVTHLVIEPRHQRIGRQHHDIGSHAVSGKPGRRLPGGPRVGLAGLGQVRQGSLDYRAAACPLGTSGRAACPLGSRVDRADKPVSLGIGARAEQQRVRAAGARGTE